MGKKKEQHRKDMIEKEKSELKCTALETGDTMTTAILSKKSLLM